jgi:hypothetical protein
MFEVIGYGVCRLLGYGWLWGKKRFIPGEDVFGNGDFFLPVGMVVCFLVVGISAIAS